MDARLLVRSKFMVSREFGTGDIPLEPLVTIAGVKKPDEKEELTRDWWLLSFEEPWAKPLKIITTHQQALILMFSGDTDHWKGKRIGLRAVMGTFFKRRQTAVRIKGSPDIREAMSFSVRKFGGGSDTYDLVVLAAPGAAAAAKSNGTPPAAPPPFVSDGTVQIKQSPSKGMQLAALTHDELAAVDELAAGQIAKAKPGATWLPNAQAHHAEIIAEKQRRLALEQAMAPTEDTPF